MPVLIDIGFNDIIISKPQQIKYPTLLDMPEPDLLGYTLETVIAEKLESVVKLALVNTRMKDFYDLWTILKSHEIQQEKLSIVIQEVFANRKTPLKYPIAFTAEFYDNKETQQRWNNFLSGMGKPQIKFELANSLYEKFDAGVFPNPDYDFCPDLWSDSYKLQRKACGQALYQSLGISLEDIEGKKRHKRRNYNFFEAPIGLIIILLNGMNSGQGFKHQNEQNNHRLASHFFVKEDHPEKIWSFPNFCDV